MEKYRWLWVVLGLVALGMALTFGAAFGAGITYFFLQAEPVQAAFTAPVEPENDQGVLISGVKHNSAAADAGLVRGDIILEIDAEPVDNIVELKQVLAELEPGEIVDITILHGDDTRILEIELDDAKGFAYLGVGTCDSSKDKGVFPGSPMGDVFIKTFPMGAEIMEVIPGSPAEESGLQVGDLIITVNQIPVGMKGDLADLIQKNQPGDVVVLEVRSGMEADPRQVEVTLGENPDNAGKAYLGVAYQYGNQMGDFEGGEFPFDKLPEGWEEDEDFHFRGMPFHDQDGLHPFFDTRELPEGVEGAVVISEVLEETPAAEAGLLPGDLIIAVDDKPVEEIEGFIDEMGSRQSGDEVSLTIIREGEEIVVQATLTEHPDDPDKGFLGVLAGTFMTFEDMQLPEGFNQDFEFELPGVLGGDA